MRNGHRLKGDIRNLASVNEYNHNFRAQHTVCLMSGNGRATTLAAPFSEQLIYHALLLCRLRCTWTSTCDVGAMYVRGAIPAPNYGSVKAHPESLVPARTALDYSLPRAEIEACGLV